MTGGIWVSVAGIVHLSIEGLTRSMDTIIVDLITTPTKKVSQVTRDDNGGKV